MDEINLIVTYSFDELQIYFNLDNTNIKKSLKINLDIVKLKTKKGEYREFKRRREFSNYFYNIL